MKCLMANRSITSKSSSLIEKQIYTQYSITSTSDDSLINVRETMFDFGHFFHYKQASLNGHQTMDNLKVFAIYYMMMVDTSYRSIYKM